MLREQGRYTGTKYLVTKSPFAAVCTLAKKSIFTWEYKKPRQFLGVDPEK